MVEKEEILLEKRVHDELLKYGYSFTEESMNTFSAEYMICVYTHGLGLDMFWSRSSAHSNKIAFEKAKTFADEDNLPVPETGVALPDHKLYAYTGSDKSVFVTRWWQNVYGVTIPFLHNFDPIKGDPEKNIRLFFSRHKDDRDNGSDEKYRKVYVGTWTYQAVNGDNVARPVFAVVPPRTPHDEKFLEEITMSCRLAQPGSRIEWAHLPQPELGAESPVVLARPQ